MNSISLLLILLLALGTPNGTPLPLAVKGPLESCLRRWSWARLQAGSECSTDSPLSNDVRTRLDKVPECGGCGIPCEFCRRTSAEQGGGGVLWDAVCVWDAAGCLARCGARWWREQAQRLRGGRSALLDLDKDSGEEEGEEDRAARRGDEDEIQVPGGRRNSFQWTWDRSDDASHQAPVACEKISSEAASKKREGKVHRADEGWNPPAADIQEVDHHQKDSGRDRDVPARSVRARLHARSARLPEESEELHGTSLQTAATRSRRGADVASTTRGVVDARGREGGAEALDRTPPGMRARGSAARLGAAARVNTNEDSSAGLPRYASSNDHVSRDHDHVSRDTDAAEFVEARGANGGVTDKTADKTERRPSLRAAEGVANVDPAWDTQDSSKLDQQKAADPARVQPGTHAEGTGSGIQQPEQTSGQLGVDGAHVRDDAGDDGEHCIQRVDKTRLAEILKKRKDLLDEIARTSVKTPSGRPPSSHSSKGNLIHSIVAHQARVLSAVENRTRNDGSQVPSNHSAKNASADAAATEHVNHAYLRRLVLEEELKMCDPPPTMEDYRRVPPGRMAIGALRAMGWRGSEESLKLRRHELAPLRKQHFQRMHFKNPGQKDAEEEEDEEVAQWRVEDEARPEYGEDPTDDPFGRIEQLCREPWEDYVPNPNYKPTNFDGMQRTRSARAAKSQLPRERVDQIERMLLPEGQEQSHVPPRGLSLDVGKSAADAYDEHETELGRDSEDSNGPAPDDEEYAQRQQDAGKLFWWMDEALGQDESEGGDAEHEHGDFKMKG